MAQTTGTKNGRRKQKSSPGQLTHSHTRTHPLDSPSLLPLYYNNQVMDIKPLMRANIVRLLRTSPGRVNVKARTHEKVDSVGEGRAMACHVVVLLEKNP